MDLWVFNKMRRNVFQDLTEAALSFSAAERRNAYNEYRSEKLEIHNMWGENAMSNKQNQNQDEFTLENELRPGEQVLWQSATGKFGLLSGTFGRKIMTKWVVTAVVMLGLLGAYLATAAQIKTGVVVILLVIMALIIVSPITECGNLKAQQYFLTNQRAILARGDRKIFTMELSDIDDAQIVQITPEETCLLLGSKMSAEPEKQYRALAVHPLGASEHSSNVEGMLFYAIQNADQALQLVSRQSAA